MALYNIGDEVANIYNPSEKGVIIDINLLIRGFQTYKVKYNNRTETELEQNLKIISDTSDPFELIKKGVFSSYIDFQQKNTSVKIRNTSNNTISTLKASKTIFQPYQYKPLLKFLNSDKRRILIGDEVGVGKTIEAGHIMLELIGRREMKNGLIICPKSLTEKWRDELLNKFNLKFKIYEHKADIISDLEFRPGVFKGIINYEKLRKIKKSSTISKVNDEELLKKDLIRWIEEKNIKFDFVVCDESHRLRNITQTSHGIEKILTSADGVAFLTATPIMTERRNLFNQLQLLDPETYFENIVFENQDRINRPIIKALNQLNNNISFQTILNGLQQDEIYLKYMDEADDAGLNASFPNKTSLDDFFNEDRLYHKVIKALKDLPDTTENRVNIQHDLSSLNTLNTIFTRTRKKDVTTDWTNAIRTPYLLVVNLTIEESEIYDEVISDYEYYKGEDNILGMIQVKRQLSSSLYAYLAKHDQNFAIYKNEYDSKYFELKKIIEEIVNNYKKKLIIFATFKATLKYLQARLLADEIKSEMISGDITERNVVISRFKYDPSISILLSSEVGSEGIDLQFCDSIVNYDLPWNPMVVEQRIGRVHRFGQKSPIVNIYTIVTEGSIEKEIYKRLLDRIGIFRSSIGDLEPILVDDEGEDILKDLEKTLYSKELNDFQKRQKLDDIAKALEQRKIDIELIKEGLDDTITSDIYFDNEIRRINENFKYVTENELRNFVYSIIDRKLPALSLEYYSNELYKLIIPKNDNNILINFLQNYSPSPEDFDNYNLYRSFVSEIKGKNELILTFNQETAYEDKNICYINTYHPLIMAITKYFDNSDKHYSFNFKLSADLGLVPGKYILGVYNLFVIKTSLKEKNTKELLVPIVFDLENQQIVIDDEFNDKMLGYAQQYAEANNEEITIPQALFEDLQIEMTLLIDKIQKKAMEEEELKMKSQLQRRKRQETLFYEFRIKQIEKTLGELLETSYDNSTEAKKRRSIIPALNKNIENYKDEIEEKSIYYDSFKLSTKAELLSISLININ